MTSSLEVKFGDIHEELSERARLIETQEEEEEALLKFMMSCNRFTPEYQARKLSDKKGYRCAFKIPDWVNYASIITQRDYGISLNLPTFLKESYGNKIIVYLKHQHDFLEYEK